MKKILAITLLVSSVLIIQAQPGKYAGNQKGLLHAVYTDSRNIPGLSEWTSVQGSVISPLSDSLAITVDVFRKGNAFLVLFSKCADSACSASTVLDVLEITVTKGWTVKAAFCLQNDVENPSLVALVKQAPAEYLKTLKKAWQFNFETNQVEQVSTKGIACANDEFDTH